MPGPDGPRGPRPTGLHHDPTTHLSAARSGVLDALGRADGPVTVQQLCDALGQHANTVREHLDGLVDVGLAVRAAAAPSGRGRPPIRYAAVPPEQSRPQIRGYAALASELAEQIARTGPDPARQALEAGRRWGAKIGAQGPDGAAGAREHTLHVLADLGFEPQITSAPTEPHPGLSPAGAPSANGANGANGVTIAPEAVTLGVVAPEATTAEATTPPATARQATAPQAGTPGVIELRACPMLEAARANPQVVCTVHLGLMQGIYTAHAAPAEGVELSPFATVGACLLRLPGGSAPSDEPAPS